MKSRNLKFWLIVFLFFTVSLALCASELPKLKVFVSILPQKFFVEQIAGDYIVAEVLVGPDMSPHSYEPLPKQMANISRADVFFSVGVSFEKHFLKKITSMFPKLKIVATDFGIKKRKMATFEDHLHEESHSHSHPHKEGEYDPHIWLDPLLVIKQSEIIALTLKDLIPNKSKEIEANFDAFKKKNEEIVRELGEQLAPLKGQPMLVFHPAFGYFADRFGLIQHSVEIEGKEPGPRQLGELIRKCRRENIRMIFVQKQFPVVAAKAIADAINGVVVPIDPLSENYFINLKIIADSLKKIENKYE